MTLTEEPKVPVKLTKQAIKHSALEGGSVDLKPYANGMVAKVTVERDSDSLSFLADGKYLQTDHREDAKLLMKVAEIIERTGMLPEYLLEEKN